MTSSHQHGKPGAKQLTRKTWLDFEKFFAANGGVWGGCWCMFFHKPGSFNSNAYERNKDAKHALVMRGKAHGTIVYCGKDPVGWCQFGPKEELPRIDNKRGYAPTAEDPWRITCLFISPGHRKSGFAKLAVTESIKAIEKLGANTVEAYPVEGSSATFLWSGTPHLFEAAGLHKVRQLGRKSWIYSREISRRD